MTSEDDWVDDLDPIKPADWDRARAKHLLNRAGFGGTPEDIDRLATLTPVEAVRPCLDGYQNPVAAEVMEFQIGLAVKEASDLEFVPEMFRAKR